MSYQLLSHTLGTEDLLSHTGAVPDGSFYGYSILNYESGHQVDFYTDASGVITAVASNLSDGSTVVFRNEPVDSGSSIEFYDGVSMHTFEYAAVDAVNGRIAFDVSNTPDLKNTIPPITLGEDLNGDGLPDSFTFTDQDDEGGTQSITVDLNATTNPVNSPGVVATAEIIWDESDYNGDIFTVTEKLELISDGTSVTSYRIDSTTNNYWGDGYYGSVEEGLFTINEDGTAATATPTSNGQFSSNYEPMDVYTLNGSEGVEAGTVALSGATYAIDTDSNVATPVVSDGNGGWRFDGGTQIILDDTNTYSGLTSPVGTLNGSSTTPTTPITPTPSGLQVYDIILEEAVLDATDTALNDGLYAIDTVNNIAYLVYWDVTDSTYYSVVGSENSIALSSSNDYGALVLSNADGDSSIDDIFYPPTTPITPIETFDPIYVQLKDVRLWEANGVTAATQAEAFSGFGSSDGSEYLLAYPSVADMTPYPTDGTITLKLGDGVHMYVDANTYALLTEAEMLTDQVTTGYDVFVNENPFDIQAFGNVAKSLDFVNNNDGTWDTTLVNTVTPADTTLKVSDKGVILDLTRIEDTSITFFADVDNAQNIHLGNGDSYTVDQGYAGFALNADGVNGTDLINTYLQGTDFVVLDVSNFDPSDGELALDLDVGAAAAGEQDVIQIDSDSMGIYYQSRSNDHDYISTYSWSGDVNFVDDIAIVRNADDAAIWGTWHDDVFETFGYDTVNQVETISDQAATFFGGDGNDWLMGSTASDFLDGGDGSYDIIEGFEGDDLLVDWDGADMSGGSGKDTFLVGDGYYGDESLPETYIGDFDLTKQGLGRNPSSVQDQVVFAVSGATLASVLQGEHLDLFKGMTFEGDGEVADTSTTAYEDFNQLFDFAITNPDEVGTEWSVQLMYGDVALGSVDLEVRSLNKDTGEYENVNVTGTDLIQAYMVGTYDLAGMISNNISELFMYETAGVADLNATWNEATLQKDGDKYLESDLFVQFAVGLEIQDAFTVFPSSAGTPKQTLMFVSDTDKGTTFVPLDASESLVGSMLGDTIRYINDTGTDIIFDRNVSWSNEIDTVDFNEINVTFDDFLGGNVTAARTELYAEGQSSLQISGIADGVFGPADNQTNATVDVNAYRHFDESNIYTVEQLVLNDGSQTGQAWDLAGVNWDSEYTDNNHAILVGHEGGVDAFNLRILESYAEDGTGAFVPADLTVFIDGFDQATDSVSIDGFDLTVNAAGALDAAGNGVWTYDFVDDNSLDATLTLYFSGTLGASVPTDDLLTPQP